MSCETFYLKPSLLSYRINHTKTLAQPTRLLRIRTISQITINKIIKRNDTSPKPKHELHCRKTKIINTINGKISCWRHQILHLQMIVMKQSDALMALINCIICVWHRGWCAKTVRICCSQKSLPPSFHLQPHFSLYNNISLPLTRSYTNIRLRGPTPFHSLRSD